jgi:HPt (histidine-containing phosphotransfer) domain-containing protein
MAEEKPRTNSRRAAAKKTTKKVAKKATAKKASSKKTTKKVPTETTVKKTTKTTTKKAATKKTSKKVAKKATNKKTTTKTETKAATKKKTASKKSTFTKKEKLTKPPRNKAFDAVTLGTSHRMAAKDGSVTIFSRVKTDNAVLLVARTFGLAFVMLGAAFSIFGLGRSFDSGVVHKLTTHVDGFIAANLVTATSVDLTNDLVTQTSVDLNNNLVDTSNTVSVTSVNLLVNREPDVTFKLPSDPVAGDTPLTFTVTNAEKMIVYARNKNTGDTSNLGEANTVDGMTWKVLWPTAKELDGEYVISVLVTNEYGSYTDKSTNLVTVDNIADTPVSQDINNNTQASTVTDTAVNDEPTAIVDEGEGLISVQITPLTDLSLPISTKTKLQVEATDNVLAMQVVLRGKEQKTELRMLQSSLSQWSGTIDPKILNEDSYLVMVVAKDLLGEIHTTSLGEITISRSLTSDGTVAATDSEFSDETLTASGSGLVEPTSEVSMTATSPLSGLVPVLVKTQGAVLTELYIRQKDSLRAVFIGAATMVDSTTWRLVWNTSSTPNGDYEIFAKHKNSYGYYLSEVAKISVKNPILVTKESTAYIEGIKDASSDVSDPIETYFSKTPVSESLPEDETADPEASTETAPSVDVTSERLLGEYRDSIRSALEAYARALRSQDETEIQSAKRRLDGVRENITSSELAAVNKQTAEKIENEIKEEVATITREIERSEEIVRKRVGDATLKDSDGDGVTDYDEVALYRTNPLAADSDNDGFTDGAEIEGGYDPNNDSQEAAITYESPKDSGFVRDDILMVESVTAAPELAIRPVVNEDAETNEEASPVTASAIITGRGLPNSFVTLYIFSTPIVITVKTDDEGGWMYHFDKELEDGEHEVFVGITDNAGKIIAKSNPFTFVKEAQAFTPVDAASSGGIISANPPQPTLFNQDTLIISAGAVLMSFGFILLMISLFMRRKREEETMLLHAA